MPTPIEQALITLVPTLNTLPQELIDLSTSLLAQSRSRAATLKQEEEIGRTYACAHLAVERLKNRLDVEKVVARPPVPPRVYKKLYGFLEAALAVAPATPRTNRLKDVGRVGSVTPGNGRGRRSLVKTPASAAKSVEDATPSGRRTRSAVKAMADDMEIADSEEERNKQETEGKLPPQIPSMVASVCHALEVPQASSHILAAMSAILSIQGWQEDAMSLQDTKTTPRSSAKKRKRTSTGAPELAPSQENPIPITPTSLPALLVAIALVTSFTLRNAIIDSTAYATARSAAIQALSPDHDPSETDVDAFLHVSKTQGWLALPWFSAVRTAAVSSSPLEAASSTPKKIKPPAKTPLHRKEKHAPRPSLSRQVDLDIVMEDVEVEDGGNLEGEEEEEEEEEGVGAGLRSGLGTMFQDSVDWLGGGRRRDYRVWERDIRRRCDEIERSRGVAV
jgi:origin recognition complex subunit 6